MNITIFDPQTGRILRTAGVPVGMASLQLTGPTEEWIEGQYPDDQFYVGNFTAVAMPPRPSENHQFNYATKQWEDPRTLADLKAAKNAAIDLARERANSTTFMFQGLSIAVDPLSKGDIMGAHGEWLTGQAPEGWPGGWKSKDKGPNGESLYVPIPDQATWLAFYRAMVAQGTANFAHSQVLKDQLAAATTAEEVAAVPDW